jgi:adenylate cyclase
MDALSAWLCTPPLTLAELVEGLGVRLRAEGVPVDRVWFGVPVAHPLVAAGGAKWTVEEGVTTQVLPYSQRERLRAPPPSDGMDGRLRRVDLRQEPRGALGLPGALWDEGYVEVALTFMTAEQEPVGFVTFATRSGFSDVHRLRLEALLPLVRIVARLIHRSELVRVVAATYLGRETGRRVVEGQIHRGEGERIRAAIWFSDLRGFSELSGRLGMEALLDLLDDAFEAQVACVEAGGGEVLKFIGDGLLAVFRSDDDRIACAAALAASVALEGALADVNARREAAGRVPIRYGLSLHFGEVMYGNIGAPERLDFTVIGPAVNLAARLEGVCPQVGRSTVVSEAFASLCPGRFEPIGRFELKGVGPATAFAPSRP